MFGALGRAIEKNSLAFVSQAGLDIASTYHLGKQLVPVRDCRSIGKTDMQLNDMTPHIDVDPETYRVTVDGEHLTCEPAAKLPLAQLYNLF